MPDISMCKGDDCPLKDTCYRFKAKASQYQSFFAEVPYEKEQDACEYYWEIDESTS